MKKTVSLLLAMVMTVGLTVSMVACGDKKNSPVASNNGGGQPNSSVTSDNGGGSTSFKLDSYEVTYKDACIMEEDGKEAIVLTLDFKNNSKEAASYMWSIAEKAFQDGIELDTGMNLGEGEIWQTMSDDQYRNIQPGKTIEIRTAFVLSDPKQTVDITFEPLLGTEKGEISIDPGTLSHVPQ